MPERTYSSTQFTLLPSQAKPFIDFASSIPDDKIYFDPNDSSYGREDEPHITVLYGLTDSNLSKLRELVSHRRPPRVRLGDTSVFSGDSYDVLKIEVFGSQLHSLHNLIKNNRPNEYSYPDYNPHLTIAYLKPGEGEAYSGDSRFSGKEFTFDKLELRDRQETSFSIQLTGTSKNLYTNMNHTKSANQSADPYLGPYIGNTSTIPSQYDWQSVMDRAQNPKPRRPEPQTENSPLLPQGATPSSEAPLGPYLSTPAQDIDRMAATQDSPFHWSSLMSDAQNGRPTVGAQIVGGQPSPDTQPPPDTQLSLMERLKALYNNNSDAFNFSGAGAGIGGLFGSLIGGGKGALAGALLGGGGGYLVNRLLQPGQMPTDTSNTSNTSNIA